MSSIKTIIALTILVLPLTGMAATKQNSPFYIGVNGAQYEATTTTTSGAETSVTYDGFMMNLGYDINNYLAVEATAGSSSSSDGTTPGTSSEIDYTAGLYFRVNLRFDRVVVSFLAGQSSTKLSTKVGSTNTSSTESGTSGGIGVDFYGTRDLAVSFRYMELYTKENVGSDTTMTATTFGITYYFDAPKIRSRY